MHLLQMTLTSDKGINDISKQRTSDMVLHISCLLCMVNESFTTVDHCRMLRNQTNQTRMVHTGQVVAPLGPALLWATADTWD